MKNIDKKNLIMLNKEVGLFKKFLSQHTALIGTTGSGKTTTALTIVEELNDKEEGTTIIVDGKGDENLIAEIQKIDPDMFVWKIDGSNIYNPFAIKDNVVLADKVMSLFEFSEPHYQFIIHDYLLILFHCLIKKNIDINLINIIKYFDVSELQDLIEKEDDKYFYLKNINQKDILGMRSRLNVYCQQLYKTFGDENSLLELSKKYKTVLFSINSLKYPELSNKIGKIIIQDLKELTALKDKELKINIIFDELNVFFSNNIINLINKSRSFNFRCFLCFQTIADLTIDNVNYVDNIFGNVNNIICQRINDVKTVEYISALFGTQSSKKITRQINVKDKSGNLGSVREVEEFIAHPNELKKLKTGYCFLKTTLPSCKLFFKKIKVIRKNT